LIKPLITTAPGFYATNLTTTFENYGKTLPFIKTGLTCFIFALQYYSSDSITSLAINMGKNRPESPCCRHLKPMSIRVNYQILQYLKARFLDTSLHYFTNFISKY